ncbi:MAG: polyprenyl synthetase family protein [Bacteroidota bacterium]
MLTLSEIKKPIDKNLQEFKILFEATLRSDSHLLDKILQYILKTKGKQIRPLFVMLAAGMAGEINKSTYTAATLVEILHSATLVHDDVVDESNMRRGFFSVKALWKNKVAVLVGDYLLSKGLGVALENNEYTILQIVAEAVRSMSEGELLQIQKARLMNIDEAVYYEIIRKKTASLISACCAAGFASVSDDIDSINKMKKFGELTGIAFQIKDDLLDFDQNNKTGKPAQNDLKDQKISLPLIYTLEKVNFIEKRTLLHAIKNHGAEKKAVKKIIEKIQSVDGFTYAEARMNEFKDEALKILSEFPNSEYKKSLEQLVIFTTERKF